METRRQMLKQTGSAILGASAISSLSSDLLAAAVKPQTVQPPTLVAIYLRGGADALNVIVPYGDKHYRTHRPTVFVPSPEDSGDLHALPLDGMFGFNPAMTGLHQLYLKGKVAPIVAVGSPHSTRSHFDAQDFMERGAPGLKYVTTGWLNRYLHETRSSTDSRLRAFALQPLLPRSMRGQYPVLARPEQKAEEAMNAFSKIYTDSGSNMNRRPSTMPGMDAKQTIEDYGVKTIAQLRELTETIEQAPAPAAEYPDSTFGRQMRDIAKIIKSNKGLEVTALDYGGWDHHFDEAPISGQLFKKLGDLSDGIAAFSQDLGARMDRTLVLVMSEFGRTVRENGTEGTDHGHGGMMIAVGGPVAEKKVIGKWLELDPKNLYENRDIPITTDFRVVFAETLQRVFNFDPVKSKLFPEYTPDLKNMDFLRQA